MVKSQGRSFYIFSSVGYLLLMATPAPAQIIPDTTLPVNSTITPDGNIWQIEAGTATGTHLFHSFSQFSVPTGTTAFFNNSPEIQNIFTRVTGNSPSNIDGVIQANGSADLFLLNPNGIVFGPNAQLNIGGSFISSTANSILFQDGSEFSAVNPQAPPLLTINVPSGLQYGSNPSPIQYQGQPVSRARQLIAQDSLVPGLEVQPDQTLALVGGDVTVNGGRLNAPQGHIHLGSVKDAYQVNLTSTPTGFDFHYPVRTLGAINLSGGATIDVSGFQGGKVDLQGRDVSLRQSSRILAHTLGSGNGNGIEIETVRLSLEEGSLISTMTTGAGAGGDITVKASDSVMINGNTNLQEILIKLLNSNFRPEDVNDGLFTSSFGTGNAGNLTIETGRFEVNNGSLLSASGFIGRGGNLDVIASESIRVSRSGVITGTANSEAAGDLRLTTKNFYLQEGGVISTTTLNSGQGGNLIINASELVDISGAKQITELKLPIAANVLFDFGISVLQSSSFNEGNGGDLIINTNVLNMANNSQIASATYNRGSAGDLIINTNVLNMTDKTYIASSNFGNYDGNAGDLIINTNQLFIRGGGQIQSATFGTSDAGDLRINATSLIEITGISDTSSLPIGFAPSGLFAVSQPEGRIALAQSGDAGSVIVNTQNLFIRDGARISVSSNTGLGKAGNIEITANLVQLHNGILRSETVAGDSGNIIVKADHIQLRHSSSITTNAQGLATGGNISIDTKTLIATDNSQISANSENNFGGRVVVNTEYVFLSPDSSITATSELGPQFSGTVTLNTPDIDPTQGLIEFPDTPVDVSQLIDQNLCQVSQNSELTATGRQGLPPSPTGTLSPTLLWQDNRTPTPTASDLPPNTSPQFIEAQGINIQPDGSWQLTPDPDTIIPLSPWQLPPGCQQLSALPSLYATTGTYSASTSPTILIQNIEFIGDAIPLTPKQQTQLQTLLEPWKNQPLTFSQLLQLRTQITQFYTHPDIGYITTGALIPPQIIDQKTGLLQVQIVAGTLEKIEVKTDGKLHPNYIKNRLEIATNGALNQHKLIDALALLQLDSDLISVIKAELSQSIYPGQSILTVHITENPNPLSIELRAENSRTPSIGSFERAGTLGYRNLLGRGDQISIGYGNTEGSDRLNASYSLPINARNGTLELAYYQQSSQVIEQPFDQVDITSDAKTYQLTFRQPIYQKPSQEFALGLTLARRESQTSILGENYPLSPGADDNGNTRLSIIRWFQDWLQRDRQQVIAARSEFSLGLGLFDATINQGAPDSQFFAWRGQGQWARRLGSDHTLLVVRGVAQLTPSDLVPMEEFALGGFGSVRGYRQDTRLTDNGVLLSAEVRLPVITGRNHSVQLVPFIDGGAGWNTGKETPRQNILASVGLGLQVNWRRGLTLRLDYGIPLVEIDSPHNTWQENGLYFSIRSSPF